jgi:2-amino-4-hydroxy-6-hydroxymethyldihydropteridine diphosphokinase
MMAPVIVFLGLGSNIGAREEHLRDGLALLTDSLEIKETSSVYETEPWGYTEQPRFLNMVCKAFTTMAPLELLAFCQQVEQHIGRTPTFRYGPRELDVDILAYGDQVIETPTLRVPHNNLADRAFVLVPLVEIVTDWEHPESGKTAKQMLKEVSGVKGVMLWSPPIVT